MDSFLSNLYIGIYIFIWIITIIAYQNRKKHIDSGSILLCTYILYSIVSLILYNNQNSLFGTFNNIKLFPFIYLYFMLMLAALPIFKYDDNKIKEIKKPNIVLLNALGIIYILSSLAHLPSIISNFVSGLLKLLFDSSGGQELYNDAMANSYSVGDGNISNITAIISSAFTNIGILIFFYNLTLEKHNKLISLGLFISIIVSIMTYISLGQRGCIVEILLALIITYFALRKFIPSKINKKIKIIGIILIIAIAIPIIALTNSRFGNGKDISMDSLYFYVGQENLYFNNYGLDDGGIRYGDRTFPLFKRIVGFDNVPHNFWERRLKYPNLKINDEVFYTFVGDFTIDFGPIIASILFLLFTLLILKKTIIRNGCIHFHQLILVHFVMCVCMLGGMKLFTFSDVGGNLQIIVYFLVYISFRINFGNSLELRKKSGFKY